MVPAILSRKHSYYVLLRVFAFGISPQGYSPLVSSNEISWLHLQLLFLQLFASMTFYRGRNRTLGHQSHKSDTKHHGDDGMRVYLTLIPAFCMACAICGASMC